MMAVEVNTRALSLDIIMECLEGNGYCNVLLKQVLDKYSYLDRRDRAFLTRLAIGTIERSMTLDAVIEQFTTTKIKKMKPVIRNILRLSAYQIYEMDGTSPYAVCNEAVELVKKYRQRSFTGFVNGILRSMIRAFEEYEKSDRKEDEPKYHFMKYRQMFPKLTMDQAAGIPPVIFSLLRKQYGEDAYVIMDAFYQHASYGTNVHILGNERALPEGLIQKLCDEGKIWPHPYNETSFQDTDGIFLTKELDELVQSSLFTEGFAIVQDFSSSVVGRLLPISEHMKVLDMCAAPGGKSIHVADRIASVNGQIISCDIYEEKLQKIQENAFRCRKHNLQTVLWDGTFENPEWKEQFDVVLCDAPCSGLGIIGNKPDIKYRIAREGENSFSEIENLQRQILHTASAYVKPGGYLIYSTCTLNKRENEEQVRWFCDTFSFVTDPFASELPLEYQKTQKDVSKLGATFIPGLHQTEGFFLCRLKKQ